ncbi:hypothetical protein J1605_008394 [Eschrichtius robustus]|uniref:Acyltransferase C-terminal domain-containing protein n=1 Tax=Eschrichtius robustus TaxID=9764 RepID=A0AB34GYF1_ESCRO|nr:hypothetical protein J1605_008394 [Eschrichtius robustus]
MFVNPSWCHWINNCLVATRLTLPVALLETMFGVKVIITERQLLLKDFPKEIHFHVHRYPADTLPKSKEDLQLWYHK